MKFSTLFPVTLPLTGACLSMASPVADKSATAHPTFFLIRHAEKDKQGLIDQQGKEREKCLVKLFGKDSNYDIQEIITPKYHPNGIPTSCFDSESHHRIGANNDRSRH